MTKFEYISRIKEIIKDLDEYSQQLDDLQDDNKLTHGHRWYLLNYSKAGWYLQFTQFIEAAEENQTVGYRRIVKRMSSWVLIHWHKEATAYKEMIEKVIKIGEGLKSGQHIHKYL